MCTMRWTDERMTPVSEAPGNISHVSKISLGGETLLKVDFCHMPSSQIFKKKKEKQSQVWNSCKNALV